MKTTNFALSKKNYFLMIIAFLLIVGGFVLMGGKPSGETFNPDIFSTTRIVIAPMISFSGFLFMIFAIMYKPKNNNA